MKCKTLSLLTSLLLVTSLISPVSSFAYSTEDSVPVDESSDEICFEDMYSMSEDELKDYCLTNNLKYTPNSTAEEGLKYNDAINVMIRIDEYAKEGVEDITFASDPSMLDISNASDYDFDRMISDLNLPEKYYTVPNGYDGSFRIALDEFIDYDYENFQPNYLKLGVIPVFINNQNGTTDLDVRLYQMVETWCSRNNSVYSILVEHTGSVTISVNDILGLAQKGDALTWSDFEKYAHTDVGSGLIVWEFNIKDDSSKLLIGGSSLDENPVYIRLQMSNGTTLDVWNDDLTPWYYDDGKLIMGDVNDDGKFNVSDVVLLQKWLLAVPNADLKNWKAADFYDDNKLDVVDLCLMKRELIRNTVITYVKPDNTTDYGYEFEVVSDSLTMYLGPDASYNTVTQIPKESILQELGYQDDNEYWLFTEYDGQYGWIRMYEADNETQTVRWRMPAAAKPVIYLYPEQETDIHVELELTEADLSTTYPKYNNGWDVTAYPDGTLVNKVDGSHHRYLFWDAVNVRTRFDFSKGFCVAGSDTESFLKEKLTFMGLTEEEMNEFLVYWLPLMEHNAYNLISFQSDAYTDTAKLNITPTPDSMLRIFMTYVPLEDAVDIEQQELSTFERNGFTVVEWGGSKIR